MTQTTSKAMISKLGKVLKRLRYPLEVMLVCARWYAAYPLSFRHLEKMIAKNRICRFPSKSMRFWEHSWSRSNTDGKGTSFRIPLGLATNSVLILKGNTRNCQAYRLGAY